MTGLSDRRVLVVEDEFYLARDVARTLQQAGATVLGPFSRQAEALVALADAAPECAIIDVNLGSGASFDVADALCARGVPFLFFTGYDREVIPSRFADVTRLEKPVDTRHLVRAAEALFEGRESA